MANSSELGVYDTLLQELRFDEINDLQHLFRIHKSTLSKFIPEVCESIYNHLKYKYLKEITVKNFLND